MRSLMLMTALLAVASAATAAPKGTKNVQTGFLFQSLKDKTQYTYVVYVPRNYDAKQDWPLILFLHGMGESGKDGQKRQWHVALRLLRAIAALPCGSTAIWTQGR